MKRIADLFVAIVTAPVWLVVMALLALLTLAFHGRPVLFSQPRGGYRGTRFVLWKFRSMTDERDGNGNLLPDERRITRFGSFMRSTSLDELPSMWNLLKGDISIVGPRPFIADYLDLYTPEQMRRHDVRPGITGWAQVTGRNALSWDEKFALDLWYVQNRAFLLDLRILYLTIAKVIARDGISAEGDVSMPRFTGSAKKLAGEETHAE